MPIKNKKMSHRYLKPMPKKHAPISVFRLKLKLHNIVKLHGDLTDALGEIAFDFELADKFGYTDAPGPIQAAQKKVGAR